jgi:hypothetical protein
MTEEDTERENENVEDLNDVSIEFGLNLSRVMNVLDPEDKQDQVALKSLARIVDIYLLIASNLSKYKKEESK